MTQASGEKGWRGLAALLALMLALLGGVARAEPNSAAAWAFDLLARVEQWRSAGPLDFLPNAVKDQPVPTAAQARIQAGYGRLPMHFEPNRGQVAEPVRFLARGTGYSLFLTDTELVTVLRQGGASQDTERDLPARSDPAPYIHADTAPEAAPAQVLRMAFAGANAAPVLVGLEPRVGVNSNHPPAEPGAFVHEPLKAASRGR